MSATKNTVVTGSWLHVPQEGWSFGFLRLEEAQYREGDRTLTLFADFDPSGEVEGLAVLKRYWDDGSLASFDELAEIRARIRRWCLHMGKPMRIELVS